jgi:hypothetical protein
MIYGLADREIRARQWLQDQATQLSQFAASRLTLKQQSAEIAFKLLDSPSQRRLRYVASLSRPCEVALSRDSKKISDLMQLHRDSPTTNVRFDIHQLCENPRLPTDAPSVYCSLCATRKIMRRPLAR